MNKIMKNKMISYIVIALIILVGIAAIFAFKLNFTLMYSEHITINVYLGKAYDLQNIKEIVEETGATGIKDMGKVMGAAKQKIGVAADGKTINEVVKELLA